MPENYHVIHRKIVIERKQLCKEWPHAIARTARGDDNNNNNNTHLFSLLSVNKFKRFLLNFLIKHMVNASLSIAELWMHSGDSGLLSSQKLEELRIVYWSHQRAQYEYEVRSRYWIWLGEFSSYVINLLCESLCVRSIIVPSLLLPKLFMCRNLLCQGFGKTRFPLQDRLAVIQ